MPGGRPARAPASLVFGASLFLPRKCREVSHGHQVAAADSRLWSGSPRRGFRVIAGSGGSAGFRSPPC